MQHAIPPTPSTTTLNLTSQHLAHQQQQQASLLPLHETTAVLDEMIRVIHDSTAEDLQLIQQIQQLTQEINALKAVKEQSYKSLIADLTSQNAALQQTIATPATVELQRKLSHLQQQRHAVQSKLQTEEQQLDEQNKENQQLQSTINKMESQATTLKQDLQTKLPSVSRLMGLYYKISGLKWDYEQCTVDKQYSGTFHLNDPEKIEMFQYDAQRKGEVEVTNALWQTLYQHHSKTLARI